MQRSADCSSAAPSRSPSRRSARQPPGLRRRPDRRVLGRRLPEPGRRPTTSRTTKKTGIKILDESSMAAWRRSAPRSKPATSPGTWSTSSARTARGLRRGPARGDRSSTSCRRRPTARRPRTTSCRHAATSASCRTIISIDRVSPTTTPSSRAPSPRPSLATSSTSRSSPASAASQKRPKNNLEWALMADGVARTTSTTCSRPRRA